MEDDHVFKVPISIPSEELRIEDDETSSEEEDETPAEQVQRMLVQMTLSPPPGTIVHFERESLGYVIVHSLLRDCQLYPKILFHKDFYQIRRHIMNEPDGQEITFFGRKSHNDYSFGRKISKNGEDVPTEGDYIEEDSWCLKKVLMESEMPGIVPVAWTPRDGFMLLFKAFLVHALDPELQIEEIKEHFDEDLLAQFHKLIDILKTINSEREKDETYDLEYLTQKGLTVYCCEQDFISTPEIFMHFDTTHGLKSKTDCESKLKELAEKARDSDVLVVRFGWNNQTLDYGMYWDQ